MKLQTTFVHQQAKTGLLWLSVLGIILPPFGMSGAAAISKASGIEGAVALAVCVGIMIASGFGLARLGRASTGTVEITKEGVDFGASQLPREAIVTAAFTPAVGRRPPSVRFVGKNERELGWLAVEDHAQADQVLTALGLAPSQTSAEFYALAGYGTTGWAVLIASVVMSIALGVGVAALAHQPAAAYLATIPLLAASAIFLPAKIHVGSDGLLYKMRVGARFFPWSTVQAVLPIEKGIQVLLKTGETHDIPTVARGKMYYEYERVAQATLIARATDALATFERARESDRGDVPDVSARVARLGRSKEEWLSKLFDREGSFREAPIRNEDLWKVVESPGADVTARAGAAAVLAREASDEDRVRLRVAAETCAEPRLRVVLDKAATGEDVMEALAEVEDERAAREA
ncbi:MAG: hypothetical protein U0270_08490 [Labilithrix sp.]